MRNFQKESMRAQGMKGGLDMNVILSLPQGHGSYLCAMYFSERGRGRERESERKRE